MGGWVAVVAVEAADAQQTVQAAADQKTDAGPAHPGLQAARLARKGFQLLNSWMMEACASCCVPPASQPLQPTAF